LGVVSLIHVEDARWQRFFPKPARPGAETPQPVLGQAHGSWDTMIELIDPERGEVIASIKHDKAFSGFVTDDLIYAIDLDDTGKPRVEIWKLSFNRG
jgi:hypothetical protein